MKFNIICFFTILCLLKHNEAAFDSNSTCPNLNVNDDVENPFTAQSIKRKLIHDGWNSPQYSNPSELIAALRDIILDMSDSDSFYYTELANQLTGYFSAILVEAENLYPNLCKFASIINKTAEWHETGDVQKYIEALREDVELVPYTLSSLQYASLVELGCKNISIPINNVSRPCYHNGLVSNQQPIWDISGRLLPWPLRAVASILFDSQLFIERAYATILTYVITEPQQYIFTHYDYSLLFEIAKHYNSAVNDSKCCCEERISRFNELNEKIAQQAKDNAEAKIYELLNKC